MSRPKMDAKSAEALKDPTTRTETFVMSAEDKARMSELAVGVIGYLQRRAKNPQEAFMIIQLVEQYFEEHHNIRGGFLIPDGEGV